MYTWEIDNLVKFVNSHGGANWAEVSALVDVNISTQIIMVDYFAKTDSFRIRTRDKEKNKIIERDFYFKPSNIPGKIGIR